MNLIYYRAYTRKEIAYEVTKASISEKKVAKDLLEKEAKNQGELLKRCEYYMGDRGYDDTPYMYNWKSATADNTSYIKALWEDYKIGHPWPILLW
jgi:hypothetical protein